MTFEEYLIKAQKEGIVDFVLRATQTDEGIQIYIYPYGKDGDSVDYKVEGNNLKFISVASH